MPAVRSTVRRSPCFTSAWMPGHSTIGSPMLMALRKKIRAKLSATTHEIPAALIAIGACSRDEPQPKLPPATMMSPRAIVFAKSGRTSSMQRAARNCGSVVFRYRAAMISSVLTSSPNT